MTSRQTQPWGLLGGGRWSCRQPGRAPIPLLWAKQGFRAPRLNAKWAILGLLRQRFACFEQKWGCGDHIEPLGGQLGSPLGASGTLSLLNLGSEPHRSLTAPAIPSPRRVRRIRAQVATATLGGDPPPAEIARQFPFEMSAPPPNGCDRGWRPPPWLLRGSGKMKGTKFGSTLA